MKRYKHTVVKKPVYRPAKVLKLNMDDHKPMKPEFYYDSYDSEMTEDANGDWVSYEDVDKLLDDAYKQGVRAGGM